MNTTEYPTRATAAGTEAPHITRLRNERSELAARLEKLKKFIDSEGFLNIPLGEQASLHEQHEVMARYLAILDRRLARIPAAPESEPQPDTAEPKPGPVKDDVRRLVNEMIALGGILADSVGLARSGVERMKEMQKELSGPVVPSEVADHLEALVSDISEIQRQCATMGKQASAVLDAANARDPLGLTLAVMQLGQTAESFAPPIATGDFLASLGEFAINKREVTVEIAG